MLNRRQFVQAILAAPAIVSVQDVAAVAQSSHKSATSIPSYLKNYATLYEKDPHAAALAWF
jgi:hypothetical protein